MARPKKLKYAEEHHNWKGGSSEPGYQKKRKQEYQKGYLRKLRQLAIDTLGGKCVRCGFSDSRALQIDHINGGGSKERKEVGYSGQFNLNVVRSHLKDEGKYQLLCANCNWIKRYENNEAKGKFNICI